MNRKSPFLQYVNKNIRDFNEVEFLFQLNSHPLQNTLAALKDTLNFMHIRCSFYSVPKTNITDMPSEFIALLKRQGKKELYYVKKVGPKRYKIHSDQGVNVLNINDLALIWSEVVFIINNSAYKNQNTPNKSHLKQGLLIGSILLLLVLLHPIIKWPIFWLSSSLFGLFISVVSLKNLFGIKNQTYDNFCKLSKKSNCDKVTSSYKWMIFRIIPFGDLSLLFFSTQVIALFLFIPAISLEVYFSIQFLLAICSVPFILLSLTYQLFKVKTFCPLCILTILILVVQFIYLLNIKYDLFLSSIENTTYYSLVGIILLLTWSFVKHIFEDLKSLKINQIRFNRLTRDYDIFKSVLLASVRQEHFPSSKFTLGSKDKNATVISIITNPFCQHCKEAHKIIEKLLDTHNNELRVEFIFNISISSLSPQRKEIFRSMTNIYLHKNENEFKKSLSNWFLWNRDTNKWLDIYRFIIDGDTKDNKILESQRKWCLKTNNIMTPKIFINNYLYPTSYPRNAIPYLMPEIIPDISAFTHHH